MLFRSMEAMGEVISNPNDGSGQLTTFQQAYLQTRSGSHHQQQCLSSSSSTAVTPSRAGAAVVAREDGGRVVICKGTKAKGRREVLSPPAYDSLPVDVRR